MKNQIEHHYRYCSGTYTEPQSQWKINRKELFALHKCLLSFEPYIVYNEFIVRIQVKWWITRKIQDSVTTKELRRLILNIQNLTFTMLLQITYQDKEDTMKQTLEILTTLNTKVASMDNKIQKLESKAKSQ